MAEQGSVGFTCQACGEPMPSYAVNGAIPAGFKGCPKCGGCSWVGTFMTGGSPVAPSAGERSITVHEHDCPTAWAFFNKHGLGSKLPPSCLVCGKVEEDRDKWEIRHLELPNIYVCAGCVSVASSATGAACSHEWVSARNQVITAGEFCPKCFAVRAEQDANLRVSDRGGVQK